MANKENLSITFDRDVCIFLNKLPKGEKSSFVNKMLRKEIHKQKDPVRYIIELQMEKLTQGRLVHALQTKIDNLCNDNNIPEDKKQVLQEVAEAELDKDHSKQTTLDYGN